MSSKNPRTLLLRTAAFFAVWLMLSQQLDPFYLGLGLATALAVALLNPVVPASGGVRWTKLALYLPWLLWQVLASGIHLAYLILHPRMPIEPKVIRYRTVLRTPAALVAFGNSITLTPGTITAEVSASELVIHSMDDAAASGLADMEERIARVFGEEGNGG
jgi:multicomponent Na+:H+ antiporter subunit E